MEALIKGNFVQNQQIQKSDWKSVPNQIDHDD